MSESDNDNKPKPTYDPTADFPESEAVSKEHYDDTKARFEAFVKTQSRQHAEIAAMQKEATASIAHLTKKLDEIYPAVVEKLKVADAIKILNDYGQGRVRRWTFWAKFIVLVGATIAAVVELRDLLLRVLR